jgi:hypothetical protein
MTEFWLSFLVKSPLFLLDMKTSHFIIACTFGIFTYLFLLGWYGPTGWLALEHKREYLKELETHLVNLEYIQGNLANRVIAMEQDEQKVIQEIQRLGYLRNTQVIIRTGVGSPSLFGASPGSFMTYTPYLPPPVGYTIAASIGVFLVFASLGVLLSRKPSVFSRDDRSSDFATYSTLSHSASRK